MPKFQLEINPQIHVWGPLYAPPPVVFCPLLKKSSYNPYLKILDFSQLLVADTPMKPKRRKGKFHIWSVGYQNRVKRVIGDHFRPSTLKKNLTIA